MSFTVITPTYNRAGLLRRCYESLTRQTCLDLEWLVVDDGSTDGTAEMVAGWARTAPFGIRLLRQPNGGKARALNRALDCDLRRFTILLDSDDALAEDAIGVLTAVIERAPTDCAGVIGNMHDMQTRSVIGRPVPEGIELSTGLELREQYGVRGDTVRVYRSDVLQRYRFPAFPGERFVPENVLFDPIDRRHRLAVARDPIYLCEYQPEGLTADVMRLRARNPRGFAASLESSAWVARKPREIVKSTLKYQVWCRQFFGEFAGPGFRRSAVYRLCLPVAVVLNAVRRPGFIFDTRATVAGEAPRRR